MLTTDVQIIKSCRNILWDLFSTDLNQYINLFFYEKGLDLPDKYAQVLEKAGILRRIEKKLLANVMVFPFRNKLIVTDFLLSVYKKKNGKYARGLDDVWVMFPHETLLFIEKLDNIKGKNALDIASGSGAISLFLADRFDKVVAADINPKAIDYARFNAVLNNLEDKIINIHSDLFSELKGQTFDYICWNGPTVAMPEVDQPERVYPLYTYGGFDGAEFTKKILDQVLSHVNKKFKIRWWDGSMGNLQQSVVEQYIRKQFSHLPVRVTIEFLNKRRGVPLKDYDRLYIKYCLNKFDLSQKAQDKTAVMNWYAKLASNQLTYVHISIISIEPDSCFKIVYKPTSVTLVGPKQVFGFEWHFASRKFIKSYLSTNNNLSRNYLLQALTK